MDIGSGRGYPASSLSNFAPHPFTFRGIEVASMEGFLQGLKFWCPAVQREVFKLVGRAAKKRGRKKNWQRDGLWIQGRRLDRFSGEYQRLLDEAYSELAKNTSFQNALLASGDAVLTHSIGKRKEQDTVLTKAEFCRRLTLLRQMLKDRHYD